MTAVFRLTLGCGPPRSTETTDPATGASVSGSPQELAGARRTVVTWLECEECNAGELDSVLALGQRVVPTLSATLIEGPSPARLEEQRLHLLSLHRQQVEYARTHPRAAPTLSESEYLSLYAANLLALYRTRSAIALERIGGAAAAEALQRALQLPLRDDVRTVVATSASRVRR